MGRHQLARKRRKPPVLMAGMVAAFALLSAAGGSADPLIAKEAVKPAAGAVPLCCVQVVTAVDAAYTPTPARMSLFSSASPAELAAAPSAPAAASRWRVIGAHGVLPAGVAPERGLQVDTIFLERSISVVFPEIHTIGGWRPDALRWHPDGLALDVMIPDPGSPEGIALGNRVVAYALENAARFGIQDAIWRGVYYTPSGPQSTGAAHFDHVHLTTYGGGYPTGDEIYYR